MGGDQSLLGNFDDSRCNVKIENGPPIVPIVGSVTFNTLARIFTGACAGFATFVCLGLIFLHAIKYSRPVEQRQIIRVIAIVPVFALLSFATTFLNNHNAQYVLVLQTLYESYAFAAFFLMVAAWIGYSQLDATDALYGPPGSLPTKPSVTHMPPNELARIIGRRWTLVFQFPVVTTILTIVTEATNAAGVYCVSSHSIHFAHLWVTIFKSISTAVAFLSLLRIVSSFKSYLKPFKPKRKLFSFKSIIFLSLVQELVFSYLLYGGHISPSKHLSFVDIAVSIPAVVVCAETVLFSLWFIYAFNIGPYLLKNNNPETGASCYQGGPLGIYAFLQAINIFDLIQGIVIGVRV